MQGGTAIYCEGFDVGHADDVTVRQPASLQRHLPVKSPSTLGVKNHTERTFVLPPGACHL